jgi:hypothetical protein
MSAKPRSSSKPKSIFASLFTFGKEKPEPEENNKENNRAKSNNVKKTKAKGRKRGQDVNRSFSSLSEVSSPTAV